MFHEFFCIDYIEKENITLDEIFNYKKNEVIFIHDDIIYTNSLFFKEYNTYFPFIKKESVGIDYTGVTFIYDTIGFKSYLCKHKNDYGNRMKSACNILIDLCSKAIEKNEIIVHFGI